MKNKQKAKWYKKGLELIAKCNYQSNPGYLIAIAKTYLELENKNEQSK